MSLSQTCALLRIYTEERAKEGSKPLYEAIVVKARDNGLVGATVLRGPMGYGASQQIRNASILDLSSNLPIVIEIVDEEQKLRTFFASLGQMHDIGLVTIEKVEVLHSSGATHP